MKTPRRYWSTAGILLTAMLLTAIGCNKLGGNGWPTPPDVSKALTLLPYESCDQLETEIKEMLVGEMERNLDGFKEWCRYEGDGPIEPLREDAQPDAAGGAAEATGTNLQEEGVDEADLIKTDGRYAYAIVGEEIKIVQVWPFSSFGLVATIQPQGKPQGLYHTQNKLIVLAEQSDSGDEPIAYMVGWAPVSTTVEEVYDVSDPSQPILIKRMSFAGDTLDSRRIDSTLYLILRSRGVVYPEFDYHLNIDYEELPPCPDSGEPQPSDKLLAEIDRLKEKNRAMVRAMTLAELMPEVGEDKEIGCTDIMRSPAACGTRLLTVVADQFADTDVRQTKRAILGNGGAVYASPDALYVSSSTMAYGWWGIPEYDFEEATVIHRFALDGVSPSYHGSAEVEGRLVDNAYVGSRNSSRFSMAQFAMSEYQGYLRVATTVGHVSRTSAESDNRVIVLDVEGPALEKVGEVTGLGKGERIYAVRFIGPRGYVVTFKKVDPLYVVDLSVPASPRVEGELKVPGFSTYLHPLDEDRIIGLGFGADDEGSFAWTQGLKLALFDVSDAANPFEVGHREFGSRGSYSPAVEEHHAFTLDKNRGMLALPVEIYEGGGGSEWGTFAYAGVLLLRIDGNGSFETIGTIEIEKSDDATQPWGYERTNVLRTVIIGDGDDEGIITLARSGVILNRIDEAMNEVGAVY